MRFLACFLLTFALERASAQSTLGVIKGEVQEVSGAAVSGAILTLRDVDENTVRTAASSAGGLYEFLNLKAGRYVVTAEKAGFATARTDEILLDSRQTRQADFTLQIAERTETIVVKGEVPPLDAGEPGTT